MRSLCGLLIALVVLFDAVGPTAAQPLNDASAQRLCRTLTSAVDDLQGDGAAFVVSYHPGPQEAALPGPLANAAFTYDNAVLAIALIGCHHIREARRVADAILTGLRRDRSYSDGRVRNAYRAGPVNDGKPIALPGYWNDQSSKWQEDGYQAGTAVGNVAWAALALLQVYGATVDPQYLTGAERLAGWANKEALDSNEPSGFAGGFSGFEPHPERDRWKSTEHNIDMMAVGFWLAEVTGNPSWQRTAAAGQSFVQAMFHEGKGFEIGTTPTNQPAGYDTVVLDVELWPSLAMAAPPAAWLTGLDVAIDQLAVSGGFDFNSDRDGMWTEGTAQAALAFSRSARLTDATRFLQSAMTQQDENGWLFSTPAARITTGLKIEPIGEPFYYFHRPHLGATAWAALAALNYDPFLPKGGQK